MLTKYNAFNKLFPKFIKTLDIDGIKFLDSGKTTKVEIRSWRFENPEIVEVPLLKIVNPKNIPFSYNSLQDLIGIELESLGKITSSQLTPNIIYNLIKFDDFEYKNYYLPNNILERFKNCVNGLDAEIVYRSKSYKTTIKLTYVIDNDFDLYWEDSESFAMDIAIKIQSIFIEDSVFDQSYFVERDKLINVARETIYDETSIFEGPIWHCVTDNFTEYETFINTQWQFINFNFIPKI
jgi:hypothetical protein